MARSVPILLSAFGLLASSLLGQGSGQQPLWSVAGEIDLGDHPPLDDATLHVYLVEAREDARARIIAHAAIYHLGPGRAARRPKFLLEVGDLGRKGDYLIQIHIDIDNDSEISKGDLISAESYPVLREGRNSKVIVKVTKV